MYSKDNKWFLSKTCRNNVLSVIASTDERQMKNCISWWKILYCLNKSMIFAKYFKTLFGESSSVARWWFTKESLKIFGKNHTFVQTVQYSPLRTCETPNTNVAYNISYKVYWRFISPEHARFLLRWLYEPKQIVATSKWRPPLYKHIAFLNWSRYNPHRTLESTD